MTQKTPDLTRSAAVLIGVSEYADHDLPPIPAAANSLVRMQRVLTDPELGNWPADRVFPFHSPKNANDVVVRLHKIAEDATELMVFYFVGHGSVSSPDNEFCMALSDSVAAHPDTGIAYRRIQSMFRNCRARVKIAILDSCYSGRAISTLSPPASFIEQSTNTEGVITLTSADYNRPAHVAPPGRTSRPLHLVHRRDARSGTGPDTQHNPLMLAGNSAAGPPRERFTSGRPSR
jgi:uncharacterized caspase-like protein